MGARNPTPPPPVPSFFALTLIGIRLYPVSKGRVADSPRVRPNNKTFERHDIKKKKQNSRMNCSSVRSRNIKKTNQMTENLKLA